ncbi:MAG TPA: DUF2442 domain-containing protein [Caulobacteraceae bacterium]|jgi:hypothetical protein|nr:DUF2442 domain-containing protein [Caulobacteraceae bacterium]
MAISAVKLDERIADVRVTAERLELTLRDGRLVAAPLEWFPRLAAASAAKREQWEISGAGFGVHWPEIDEDIGVAGLLRAGATKHQP